MLELGRKVRDRITGFQGTVTGFVTYISGCNQALVMPKAEGAKAADGAWFDEQRLEYVGSDKIVLDNSKTPGADMPAPVR